MRYQPTRHPRLAALTLLVSAALLTAACSSSLRVDDALGSELDSLGFDDTDDTADADPDGSRPAGTGRQAPLVNGVRLVDDECYDDEARCGRAQLSQTFGSVDRIEIGYRVVRDTGDDVPIVVLTRAASLPSVDLDAFEDRTVIEIGERGVWPSRPGLDCAEWNGTDDDLLLAATRACRDRLVNAGVDVGTDDLVQRAADVVDLLGALGYTEADMVAPARRAGLVPHIADAMSIRRVLYVDPFFDGTDLFANGTQRTVAALDFVWDQCAAAATCTTTGSVADLFDTIATLENNPLSVTGRDDLAIDDALALRLVSDQLGDARSATFLPELQRMLLARDGDGLAAALEARYQPPDDSGITLACDQLDDSDVEGGPTSLDDWANQSLDRYTELCPIWFGEAGERAPTADPHLDGAAIVTAVAWQTTSATDGVPHIVEPTVGSVSDACVWDVAGAWFDRGEVDAASCTTTLEFRSRNAEIVATPGDYVHDEETTVRLPVPEGWLDSGYGTWTRNADPLDSTLLDVWVRSEDGPEAARQNMIANWALDDPTLSSEQVGGQEWFFASGPETDSVADYTYTIAIAVVDGQILALVLSSDNAEHVALRASVLEPAMVGAEIR